MTHPFTVGDMVRFGGVTYFVELGKKKDAYGNDGNDMRLMAQASNLNPRPILMSELFLAADFMFQNEDALYPPPKYLGGQKFRLALDKAMMDGWRGPTDFLIAEKKAKRELETV